MWWDITWKLNYYYKILIMQIDVDCVDSRHIIIELCHINDAQRFYRFTKRQTNQVKWRATERKRERGAGEKVNFFGSYTNGMFTIRPSDVHTKSCAYLLDGDTRRIWNEFLECLTLINKHEILELNIWVQRIPSDIYARCCLSFVMLIRFCGWCFCIKMEYAIYCLLNIQNEQTPQQ